MIRELDARGLACPKPVIKTKNELENMSNGELSIILDNAIAKQNILKLASSLNLEAVVVKEEKDLIKIKIIKGNNQIDKEIGTNKLENTCVFISSDKMGDGNAELGKVLIKGFIYTLTETKPHPKYVILVNSGVKLSTENEDTVENLKILQENGVEVISCGTCLDYYGIKDKLKVGEITNMYNILEVMKNTEKNISI